MTVRSNDGMCVGGFRFFYTAEPFIALKYEDFGLRVYIGVPYYRMNW